MDTLPPYPYTNQYSHPADSYAGAHVNADATYPHSNTDPTDEYPSPHSDAGLACRYTHAYAPQQ